MGVSQITAGLYSNQNRLNLERFPITGLIKTHSKDNLITDSAAGATAFSTGQKTYTGAIGVDADTVPHPTILEMAEADGMATGIIVTSEITHATPAAFYAHQYARRFHEAIAKDLMKVEVDLLVGGGQRYFLRRRDQDNLFLTFKLNGYSLRNIATPFSELDIPDFKKLAYFTAEDKPPYKSKGRNYLPDAVSYAPPFLKERSSKGFFLLVEGSQIDWGGHANHIEDVVTEMLDFDEAVGNMLDFAEKDGHTLVIVTADHETGGLAIKQGSYMGRDSLNTSFATGGHTCHMVPVFAYGPGAEAFSGMYDNTEIFYKMKAAMGLKEN